MGKGLFQTPFFVIGSVRGGAGKSALLAHLAIFLHGKGRRVALIDSNSGMPLQLRRAVPQSCSVETYADIGELTVEGGSRFRRTFFFTNVDRISFFPAYRLSNPSLLIRDATLRDFFMQLRASFDAVFLNLPPGLEAFIGAEDFLQGRMPRGCTPPVCVVVSPSDIKSLSALDAMFRTRPALYYALRERLVAIFNRIPRGIEDLSVSNPFLTLSEIREVLKIPVAVGIPHFDDFAAQASDPQPLVLSERSALRAPIAGMSRTLFEIFENQVPLEQSGETDGFAPCLERGVLDRVSPHIESIQRVVSRRMFLPPESVHVFVEQMDRRFRFRIRLSGRPKPAFPVPRGIPLLLPDRLAEKPPPAAFGAESLTVSAKEPFSPATLLPKILADALYRFDDRFASRTSFSVIPRMSFFWQRHPNLRADSFKFDQTFPDIPTISDILGFRRKGERFYVFLDSVGAGTEPTIRYVFIQSDFDFRFSFRCLSISSWFCRFDRMARGLGIRIKPDSRPPRFVEPCGGSGIWGIEDIFRRCWKLEFAPFGKPFEGPGPMEPLPSKAGIGPLQPEIPDFSIEGPSFLDASLDASRLTGVLPRSGLRLLTHEPQVRNAPFCLSPNEDGVLETLVRTRSPGEVSGLPPISSPEFLFRSGPVSFAPIPSPIVPGIRVPEGLFSPVFLSPEFGGIPAIEPPAPLDPSRARVSQLGIHPIGRGRFLDKEAEKGPDGFPLPPVLIRHSFKTRVWQTLWFKVPPSFPRTARQLSNLPTSSGVAQRLQPIAPPTGSPPKVLAVLERVSLAYKEFLWHFRNLGFGQVEMLSSIKNDLFPARVFPEPGIPYKAIPGGECDALVALGYRPQRAGMRALFPPTHLSKRTPARDPGGQLPLLPRKERTLSLKGEKPPAISLQSVLSRPLGDPEILIGPESKGRELVFSKTFLRLEIDDSGQGKIPAFPRYPRPTMRTFGYIPREAWFHALPWEKILVVSKLRSFPTSPMAKRLPCAFPRLVVKRPEEWDFALHVSMSGVWEPFVFHTFRLPFPEFIPDNRPMRVRRFVPPERLFPLFAGNAPGTGLGSKVSREALPPPGPTRFSPIPLRQRLLPLGIRWIKPPIDIDRCDPFGFLYGHLRDEIGGFFVRPLEFREKAAAKKETARVVSPPRLEIPFPKGGEAIRERGDTFHGQQRVSPPQRKPFNILFSRVRELLNVIKTTEQVISKLSGRPSP